MRCTMWHRTLGYRFWSSMTKEIALVSNVCGREAKKVEYFLGSESSGLSVESSSSAWNRRTPDASCVDA